MTSKSIYETITVAVYFAIDPSTHHWAALWARLEIHLRVGWLWAASWCWFQLPSVWLWPWKPCNR